MGRLYRLYFIVLFSYRHVLAKKSVYFVHTTINQYDIVIEQYFRSNWPLVCWDCGFESHRGHGCFFVYNVVCCQVEVSATS
jgi:hypothetical protein